MAPVAVSCVGVVVAYDPLRRRGFMRVLKPVQHGRVHFVLGCLAPAFKQRVVDASRTLNQSESRRLPPAQWQALMNEVSSLLVGRCFSVRLLQRNDGVSIERGSAERLPEAECEESQDRPMTPGSAGSRRRPTTAQVDVHIDGKRVRPSTK